MTYTLQQLSDLEEIRTLKHRYFRCIDTANIAELAELFTPDVTIDYRGGHYRVTLRGRENMLEFLANSFHSDAVAMHHGHMPEISLTGRDSADGTWYLEDVFISLTDRTRVVGSAIYKDRYVRLGDLWKIAHSEYDRVIELTDQLGDDVRITAQYLRDVGRRPEQRTDMSQFISWSDPH
jgi:hypothetical protein